MIGTLESSVRVTLEIRTHAWILIGIVAAVVGTVADVGERDAETIVTLESGLWTIFSSGISGRATKFVAHVATISRSIATKIRRDAMAAGTLEALMLAHPSMTFLLVTIVTAIVFAIASPSGRYALAVFTFEFRFGALAILVLAHHFRLVAAVSAIIREIAEPLLRHTPIIGAFKVHIGVALWTVFRTLVGTVATVILAVAEQPFWNAPVICVSRTTLPSGRAILLTTHVRWLVAIIPAVIVRIAHP